MGGEKKSHGTWCSDTFLFTPPALKGIFMEIIARANPKKVALPFATTTTITTSSLSQIEGPIPDGTVRTRRFQNAFENAKTCMQYYDFHLTLSSLPPLSSKMRDNHQMGQFGPGMGLGKMAYGMGGYGMGMYGAGHGMGYGMGMGHGSMYGHHGQDGDDVCTLSSNKCII